MGLTDQEMFVGKGNGSFIKQLEYVHININARKDWQELLKCFKELQLPKWNVFCFKHGMCVNAYTHACPREHTQRKISRTYMDNVLLVRGPWNKQIRRDRKWNRGLRALAGEGKQESKGSNGEFNGYRIAVSETFFLSDDEILEMVSGDGSTTLWMHLMPLN